MSVHVRVFSFYYIQEEGRGVAQLLARLSLNQS